MDRLRREEASVGNVVRFPSGAARSRDADSTRFDLIPADALERLARRFALGAKAYGDRNWERGIPVGVVLNHLEAHLSKWKQRKNWTDDHLAAVAWGVFALMHYETIHPELIEEFFSLVT